PKGETPTPGRRPADAEGNAGRTPGDPAPSPIPAPPPAPAAGAVVTILLRLLCEPTVMLFNAPGSSYRPLRDDLGVAALRRARRRR
ncbi:hypothetical protein GTY57_01255, partial [Streptomyces sp. SID5475]|nr:hypothetical protein [Streptomyces sp. SID5475]